MKSAYAICVLLCITIGSLVLADEGTTQTTNETQASNKSIPLPNSTAKTQQIGDTKSSTTAVPNNITQSTPNPNITTTPTSTTTTTKTSTSTSTTTTTTTPVPTTPSSSTTTTTTTTVSPPITTTNATTSSTTVSTSTTAATTAIPTGAPPPSKDRHFDGLSFFGGIILATCLMAIAAFSWKFYRQCNERNYRTL